MNDFATNWYIRDGLAGWLTNMFCCWSPWQAFPRVSVVFGAHHLHSEKAADICGAMSRAIASNAFLFAPTRRVCQLPWSKLLFQNWLRRLSIGKLFIPGSCAQQRFYSKLILYWSFWIPQFLCVFLRVHRNTVWVRLSSELNKQKGAPVIFEVMFAALYLQKKHITRWPFFVFLGGAMFCLLSSTTCHLFSCISPHCSYLLLRLDYTGIALLIAGSFYPPVLDPSLPVSLTTVKSDSWKAMQFFLHLFSGEL